MTLPDPPDPADLVDFPYVALTPADIVVRIHRAGNPEGNFFNAETDPAKRPGRFNPPPGETGYGTCYAAASLTGAFLETIGHDAPHLIAESEVTSRLVSWLRPATSLVIANTLDPSVIGEHAIDLSMSTGSDPATLAACRRWGQALRAAGFDGVTYLARHDPPARQICCAVFGAPNTVDDTRLIVDDVDQANVAEITAIARVYGFHVVPDVVL